MRSVVAPPLSLIAFARKRDHSLRKCAEDKSSNALMLPPECYVFNFTKDTDENTAGADDCISTAFEHFGACRAV